VTLEVGPSYVHREAWNHTDVHLQCLSTPLFSIGRNRVSDLMDGGTFSYQQLALTCLFAKDVRVQRPRYADHYTGELLGNLRM